MENKVFDRIEKKYLITRTEKKKIIKTIKKHMEKDGYFRSEVFNCYFDTNNYDLIIKSIDQPYFKEKIRARSYGGYDRVFLELKTKMRGKDDANAGNKRRVMITKDDYQELITKNQTLEQLAGRSEETESDIQIAREIDYLIKTLDLKPKILVMYNRESYKGDENLRLTFDENLKYRDENLDFFSTNNDKIYFEDRKNIIMEVKAHGSFPLWLVELLSKNHIYPQRFSKIGNIYTKLRKEK